VSVAAGFAVWASFPPLSCWWAAPVGVAALLVVLADVSAPAGAGLGFVFGVGLLVPMMSFLRGIGVDAWLVVAVLEALWFAVQGVALAFVRRRPWWPLAAPAVWLAVEWTRDRWPFGGFPWARIAFGQSSGPLLPLAAWGGAPLVGFVVVALGAALAWTVHRLRLGGGRRGVAVAIGATGAVAGVALGLAAVVPVPTHGSTRSGANHVVVAAVQGDVPRLGLAAFAQRRTVTQYHLDETEALAARVRDGTLPAPAFVVWPENASDQDPYTDPVARSMVDQAVAAVDVPVLVGAVVNGPDAAHVQNTAIVWNPATGPGETYVKRHLVPFGEYLPLRHLLTRIAGRFSLIAKDFAPGHRPGVLDIAGVRIADAICFEVADDNVVRQAVNGGGRLLVVQTNNATYERRGDDGHGGETAQQLEMSRLRAVEHGRAVIVAATSGVSAVINPDGRVLQRSGVYTPALLVADVPLRDALTISDRLGAWPERVVAALGLLAVLLALPRRRRPDRSRASAEPSAPAVLARQP
jgi:apolipoprotein N-acyltransferase